MINRIIQANIWTNITSNCAILESAIVHKGRIMDIQNIGTNMNEEKHYHNDIFKSMQGKYRIILHMSICRL